MPDNRHRVEYILPAARLRVSQIIPAHPLYDWLFSCYTTRDNALIDDIRHIIYSLPSQCRWRVLQSAFTDVFMTRLDLTDTAYHEWARELKNQLSNNGDGEDYNTDWVISRDRANEMIRKARALMYGV